MIEVVYRHGFRLGGIEVGGLVEVVGEGFLGGLVLFRLTGVHGELGLGWPPGGVEERGRSGLSDMGQDLCDGVGVGEERDERERRLTGWADEGKIRAQRMLLQLGLDRA